MTAEAKKLLRKDDPKLLRTCTLTALAAPVLLAAGFLLSTLVA